jgi:hypothetical protein
LIAGAFFLFAVTSCAIGTNAQSVSTGAVVGTINDPGGAVVLDATVTLQNKATNSQVTQRPLGSWICLWISDGHLVDTVRKIGYSDNQIHEENEHNRHGSFAQFCRLR